MEPMATLLKKKEAERGLYHSFGAESGIPGFRMIFESFAEDEMRHEQAIRSLKRGINAPLGDSPTLERAQGILRRLAVDGSVSERFRGDVTLLDRALQFEALSARILSESAARTEDPGQKELLLRLAAEEETHFTLLEQMRELVYEETSG